MIAGIILCGGASRRMGQPKADIDFLGESLLTRMIRIVGEVCRPIVVAAGPLQVLPKLPDELLVSRDVTSFGGPIQGLRSAFYLLSGAVTHAFIVGCDMPLLKPEMIQLFVDRAQPGKGVAAGIGGTIHPLPIVLPNTDLINSTRSMSIRDYMAQLNFHEISESELRQCDTDLQSFRPMNTPEELAEALRLANS